MVVSAQVLLWLVVGWLSVLRSSTFPSVAPSKVPTATPTVVPTTARPTVVPTTAIPTAVPTAIPTVVPTTAIPSKVPTAIPTVVPTTARPTVVPTAIPSKVPTAIPSKVPTAIPTVVPTAIPSKVPTAIPSKVPTAIPSKVPTATPSKVPTARPTVVPTTTPSVSPSKVPTATPTVVPTTAMPTAIPTVMPTQIQSIIATEDTVYDSFLDVGYDLTPRYLTLSLTQSSLSTASLGHIDTYVYVPSNSSYKLINECSVTAACVIYDDSTITYCTVNYDVTEFLSNSSNGALTLKHEYNIADGTTVSPICIYNGTKNVYFVMTATVGINPSPTSAPTSLGNSISRLNSQAPYYITGLAFFLFAGLGVVIVRLREKNSSLVQLDIFKTCLELATLGASLVSELYIIADMFITPGYFQFGVSLLAARLIHVIPSSYVLITLFAPHEACKQSAYHKLLSKEGLYDHLNEYTVVIAFISVESILLKLLPWNHSSFAALSFGFPDIQLMRAVLYAKLLQSLISIIVQSIVISIYGFGFALSYITLSLTVITFVQGLVKSIVKISVMKDKRVSLLPPSRRGSAVDSIKLSQMIENNVAGNKNDGNIDGLSVIDVNRIIMGISFFYTYLVDTISGKDRTTKLISPDATGESRVGGEVELGGTTVSTADTSCAGDTTSSFKRIIDSVRLYLSSPFTTETAEEVAFTHSITGRNKDADAFFVKNPVIVAAAEDSNFESEVLAADWVELYHKKYQKTYWKNAVTGDKTWKKPLQSTDTADLNQYFTKIRSDRAVGGADVTITVLTDASSTKESAFLNRVVKMSK